jgi:hypothetical protein
MSKVSSAVSLGAPLGARGIDDVGVTSGDIERSIAGLVVYDDKLDWGVDLRANAPKAGLESLSRVTCRNDY